MDDKTSIQNLNEDSDEQRNEISCQFQCFGTKNCEYYKTLIEAAVFLVDELLYEATKGFQQDYCICQHGKYPQVSRWPSIKDFDVALGKNKIVEYLNGFSFSENWLFYVQFTGCCSDSVSDFYLYQAIYSIPTKMYPVAQATVSLYFRFEVSRVISQNCPVTVTYRLEATNITYKPYEADITESLLFNIVNSKLKLYEKFKF